MIYTNCCSLPLPCFRSSDQLCFISYWTRLYYTDLNCTTLQCGASYALSLRQIYIFLFWMVDQIEWNIRALCNMMAHFKATAILWYMHCAVVLETCVVSPFSDWWLWVAVLVYFSGECVNWGLRWWQCKSQVTVQVQFTEGRGWGRNIALQLLLFCFTLISTPLWLIAFGCGWVNFNLSTYF